MWYLHSVCPVIILWIICTKHASKVGRLNFYNALISYLNCAIVLFKFSFSLSMQHDLHSWHIMRDKTTGWPTGCLSEVGSWLQQSQQGIQDLLHNSNVRTPMRLKARPLMWSSCSGIQMPRNSSATVHSLWMCKVLTLCLRLSPATLWKNLILAACICNLVLSVTTQSSRPWVGVGL